MLEAIRSFIESRQVMLIFIAGIIIMMMLVMPSRSMASQSPIPESRPVLTDDVMDVTENPYVFKPAPLPDVADDKTTNPQEQEGSYTPLPQLPAEAVCNDANTTSNGALLQPATEGISMYATF